jgi:hypothetical protein
VTCYAAATSYDPEQVADWLGQVVRG